MKRYQAVLFDLDGTLLDTVGEITDAVNDVIVEKKLSEPLPVERVRSWIGNGARALFTRALEHCNVPKSALNDRVDHLWPLFYEAFKERSGSNSTPYPGMMLCLDRLRDAGYQLAIVTNKDSVFTERVLRAHQLQDYFTEVACGDTYSVKKPDPAPLLGTLDKLGVTKPDALFIGDSITDVKTGKAANVRTWAFLHGYHHGLFTGGQAMALTPDRLLTGFDELADVLT